MLQNYRSQKCKLYQMIAFIGKYRCLEVMLVMTTHAKRASTIYQSLQ